jgi:hypothetical protein
VGTKFEADAWRGRVNLRPIVYAPEQEEDGKPARMIVYGAVFV